METIQYSGGRFWIAYFGMAGIVGVGAVVVAFGGHPLALIFGGMALLCLHDAWGRCFRVELHPSGELVLQYVLRRRSTRAEAVHKITLREHDEGPNDFDVRFDGGRFTLEADDDSARLMHALVRLNPSIEREGIE